MESDIHVQLALKQTDSKLLRAIEEAILRLDQGVYGICMDCEEEIAVQGSTPYRGREFASIVRNVRERPRRLRRTAKQDGGAR